MTTTGPTNGSASTAPAEDTTYTARGDISEVRRDIIRGLVNVVTEAGHQGMLYVHDWLKATDYGKTATEDAPNGPSNELLHAHRCLDLAVQHMRRLRDEVSRQFREDEYGELPF